MAQTAVGGGEIRVCQGFFQEIFDKIVIKPVFAQNLGCNLSWFFTAHNLNIMAVPFGDASDKVKYARGI